eukprot:773221-Rhodomonas_salina.2
MMSALRLAVFVLAASFAFAEADSNSSCGAHNKSPLHSAPLLPSMLSSADAALLGQLERDLVGDPWMKPVPSPTHMDSNTDISHSAKSRSFRERSVKSRAMLTGDFGVLSSGSVVGTVPEVQLPNLV